MHVHSIHELTKHHEGAMELLLTLMFSLRLGLPHVQGMTNAKRREKGGNVRNCRIAIAEVVAGETVDAAHGSRLERLTQRRHDTK